MEYKSVFKMAGYFVIGSLILHAISGVQGVLDVTCNMGLARIDINRNSGVYLGGYISRDDYADGATVTFGREADTGTGNGLPSGSSTRNLVNGRARLLYMPQTGGVQLIGAFYCEAQKGSIKERIPAIVIATNSVVTPRRISQTVSVGDDVTLSVITDIVNTRWRLNGSEIGEWDDQNYRVQRSNVQVNHGGIYECHQDGKRAEGRHAIFLLVVRACASGKWGLPTCPNDCPMCFNGGICDERSGDCVCAPGFSGNNCEIVRGSNIFGQDLSWNCGTNNTIPRSTACRGRLFCLPHPYGCSCGTGFHGIDCIDYCQPGTYGANCESDCHCAEGVSCFPDTGECSDGGCHPDWFGVNCQYRCHCAEGVDCLPDTGCSDGQCHKDWNGFQCQVVTTMTTITSSTPDAKTVDSRLSGNQMASISEVTTMTTITSSTPDAKTVDSRLSDIAIAVAIGGAIMFVFLLVIGCIVFVVFKRRSSKPTSDATPPENPGSDYTDINPLTIQNVAEADNAQRNNVLSLEPDQTYAYADIESTTLNETCDNDGFQDPTYADVDATSATMTGYSTYVSRDDNTATDTNTPETIASTSARRKLPMPPPVEFDTPVGDVATAYYINNK